MKWILLLFLNFNLFYCSPKNEVIVTLEGGQITRNEFREYYTLNKVNIDTKTASIKRQTDVLNTLAIQYAIFLENGGESQINSQEYKNLYDLALKQLVAMTVKESFIESKIKSHKYSVVLPQFILIKANADKTPKTKEAEQYKKELESISDDAKIFEYIASKTDEMGRKPIGGYLEPLCINCSDDPLSKIFIEGSEDKNLKKFFTSTDEYSNVFLYRVVEKKSLSIGDMEVYIKNKLLEYKAMADKYLSTATSEEEKKAASYYAEGGKELDNKARLTAQHYQKEVNDFLWKAEYSRLQKERGLKISENITPDKVDPASIKEDTVLLEEGGKKFTYKDLMQETSKFENFTQKPDEALLLKERLSYFHSVYLPSYVLANGKQAEEIQKSERYLKKVNFIKRELSANLWRKKIYTQKVNISEEELKQTYEAGKMYTYIDPTKSTDSKKVPLPYEAVKDRITEELSKSKLDSKAQEALEEIRKKYKIKVNNELLKEGQI